MKHSSWAGMLLAPVMAGVTLMAGATTAMAQGTSASIFTSASAHLGSVPSAMVSKKSKSSHSKPMGSSMSGSSSTTSMKSMVQASDLLFGPAASPPMGPGNGQVNLLDSRKASVMAIPLAQGANAFKSAVDGHVAYVPTLQGTTYVVNLLSRKVITTFSTPKGARIADIAKRNHLLLITAPTSVTAYALPSRKLVWTANVGGNTLAVAGRYAYVSGNALKTTQIVDLATGKVTGSIPVGMIEDSVYDAKRHTLWLADFTNGDMTIVNTKDNKVERVIQEKEGGGFSMADMSNKKAMMMAKGGFMQLAVGPQGKHVYAASFSGNIMVYDATNNTFKGDISTLPMAKLSGIAIDPSGRYAYTTVENQMETIAVSLKTDKVVATYPKVESNRWSVIKPMGMS